MTALIVSVFIVLAFVYCVLAHAYIVNMGSVFSDIIFKAWIIWTVAIVLFILFVIGAN
jgi:hypothetical protein